MATPEQTDCPICFDTINEQTGKVVMSCKHSFHLSCIATWLQTKESCPCCRSKTGEKEKVAKATLMSALSGSRSRDLWEEVLGSMNRTSVQIGLNEYRDYSSIYINRGGGASYEPNINLTYNTSSGNTIAFRYC